MGMGGKQCQTQFKIWNFNFENQQLWGKRMRILVSFKKKSKNKVVMNKTHMPHA
jgi:hypothetical protein